MRRRLFWLLGKTFLMQIHHHIAGKNEGNRVRCAGITAAAREIWQVPKKLNKKNCSLTIEATVIHEEDTARGADIVLA